MATLTQQQYDTLKQKGLTDERIAEMAKQRGDYLPTNSTGLKGVGVGLVKGVGATVKGLADLGRPIQAALDPKNTLADYNADPRGRITEEMVSANSRSESVGKGIETIAEFFVPTAKTAQIGGRILKGAGDTVSRIGIGLSSKEAPLIQMYRAKTPVFERMSNLLKGERSPLKPTTNRETALNKNIFGTEGMIGVQARRGADKVWKELIEPALNKSTTKVNFKQFIKEMDNEIESVVDLSRKAELKNALASFADDYKSVGDISLGQLQKFKEGWAKFIPEKAYQGKPIAASFREVQNIGAQIARNKIYKELGGEIKAAYFDYGNLKNLQALGEKALTGSKLKGGAGGFINGIKDATLTPVATTAGLTLYKTGKGLEFVGTAGLKKVKDLFGL